LKKANPSESWRRKVNESKAERLRWSDCQIPRLMIYQRCWNWLREINLSGFSFWGCTA